MKMPPVYRDLPRWESRSVAPVIRGRRLDGAGPRIHFLSGNGFCGGVYWPLLREFAETHALFMHDIEGHGDSDAPPRFSGINGVTGRIVSVMEEQGLRGQPLIGMGHSFGGALTLKLAADHPGLFKALVLLDPILIPPLGFAAIRLASRLGRHPFAAGARKRRDRWPSRAAAVERLKGRGIYKGWTDECFDHFAEYALREDGSEWTLCCPRELEAQIFEHPVYPWKLLRQVDIPVLYLYGAQSYEFFPASARKAARMNPNVTVQTLPGGHCFMEEDPAAAAAAVRAYLDEVSRR